MRILHIGCGRKIETVKSAFLNDEVISLDADAFLSPDIVCCLGKEPIPLEDNSIDLVIAIHVLEHIGKQGDTQEWFKFWEDLYRVLVPEGKVEFESPLFSSVWAWADPSHSRAISPQAFVFFFQDSYRIPNSAISPYRIQCDFHPIKFEGIQDSDPNLKLSEPISHFRGVLTAKKPLKAWWSD